MFCTNVEIYADVTEVKTIDSRKLMADREFTDHSNHSSTRDKAWRYVCNCQVYLAWQARNRQTQSVRQHKLTSGERWCIAAAELWKQISRSNNLRAQYGFAVWKQTNKNRSENRDKRCRHTRPVFTLKIDQLVLR